MDREKEKNNVLSLIGQEENSLTNLLEELRNKSDTSIDTFQNVLITPNKTVECSAGNALDQSKTDEFDGDDGSEPVRSREKLHSQKKLVDFWNVTNTKNYNVSGARASDKIRLKNLDEAAHGLKEKAEKDKNFGAKIENTFHSSILWGRKLDLSNKIESDSPIPKEEKESFMKLLCLQR